MKHILVLLFILSLSLDASSQVKPKRLEKADTTGQKVRVLATDPATGVYGHQILDDIVSPATSFVDGDDIYIINPNGDTTFVGNVLNIYNGISDTTTVLFVDSTGLNAADPCLPSIEEIDSFNMAQVPPVINGILYFNCSDDSLGGQTFIYYVNADTNILVVEAPLDNPIQLRRINIPSPAFANPGDPKNLEALAFARSRPGGLLPGTILVQGEGAIPMHQSFDNPTSTWLFDGVNVTQIKEFPKKSEIPSVAFTDPDDPKISEIFTWLDADTIYTGNDWYLYLIGSGTAEDPDFVFRVAGDYETDSTSIFIIKKPASVTGAATDLSNGTRTTTTYVVNSSTGDDVTLQPATSSLAGVMPAADKTKTDFITVTEAVNLDSVPVAWSFAPLTGLTTVTFNNGNSITYSSNEVLYNNGVLSGVASHVVGIDYNTGIIYYRNGAGNWAAAPSGESTTVTDTENGLDIFLTGSDITIAPDPMEYGEATIEPTDSMAFWDISANLPKRFVLQYLINIMQDSISPTNGLQFYGNQIGLGGALTQTLTTITGTDQSLRGLLNGSGHATFAFVGKTSMYADSSQVYIGLLDNARTGHWLVSRADSSITGLGKYMHFKGRLNTNTVENRWWDLDQSNYIGFQAPSTISANQIWTWPDADGTDGQALVTDGAGVLSFETVSGAVANAWYDTGVKTIKIKSSSNSTAWITETAIGTYTIVVPVGEEVEAVSFVSTTAGGGTQNVSSGAFKIVLDDSANVDGRNQTLADASPVTVVGISSTAGETYMLGTLNASAHTVATTFAASVMTVTLGGFPGQFADGSKISIQHLNGE
jgi:hypothetical protein